MTGRIRRVPRAEAVADGSIQFKNFVREDLIVTKNVKEPTVPILYGLCRTKCNQVMMMKRRGYEIPASEEGWIEASLDEEKLLAKVREYMRTTIDQKFLKEVFNQTYKIRVSKFSRQDAFATFPLLENGQLRIGEFGYQGGDWKLVTTEDGLFEDVEYQTNVIYTSDSSPDLDEYPLEAFSPVSKLIIISMGSETEFKKSLLRLGEYRQQNIEIFHQAELYIDCFQHWLVPDQREISDRERILLLSPFLMKKNQGTDIYEKKINSKITEKQLPTIHFTDIAIRMLGVLPGKIVFWKNKPYISGLNNWEFGYMMVVGYKFSENPTAEDIMPGSRRGEDEEELEEEEEELELEEDIVDEEDFDELEDED